MESSATDLHNINQLIYSGEIENIELALTMAEGLGMQNSFVLSWMDIARAFSYVQISRHNVAEQIGKLINREELYFNSYSAFKSIPKNIGFLKNAFILKCGNNQIAHLPNSICQMTQLITINLSKNRLRKLPEDIGQLSRLRRLYLSKNNLKELPKSICELELLRELNLCKNRLERLPEDIGRLKSLKCLQLTSNKIAQKEQQRIQQALPNCKIIF